MSDRICIVCRAPYGKPHREYCPKYDPSRSPAGSTAEANAEIADVVFRFIDRMNDYCDADPAERILDEFTRAVQPAILKRIESR